MTVSFPSPYLNKAPSIRIIFGLIILSIFASCSEKNSADNTKAQKKLTIVTTTGILADAVRNITGDRADVISIMGPGVDPHLYKATQGDLGKLTSADLVVYNGLHLEGKMGEVLEKLGRQRKVVAFAEYLPKSSLRSSSDFPGSYDPHIWFNVALWKDATNAFAKDLAKIDTSNTDVYRKNSEVYMAQLDSLHQWAKSQINTIPLAQRTLITAHDAFGYFGQAYSIEVRGLQGISTVSEYGLQDVSGLVSFIVSKKIKAVFVESSVPQKAIEAVVTGCRNRGHEVQIGGTLYSDALGEENTPEGTYAGMVRYNVETIVKALR